MATIRDVAKAANVSAATVSRILNNDPSLSTSLETKQKVLEAAKALNYTKTKATTKSSFHLGIVQWFTPPRGITRSLLLVNSSGHRRFLLAKLHPDYSFLPIRFHRRVKKCKRINLHREV